MSEKTPEHSYLPTSCGDTVIIAFNHINAAKTVSGYHVTSKANADKILKEGFKSSGSQHKEFYFWLSPNSANKMLREDAKGNVIIKVKLNIKKKISADALFELETRKFMGRTNKIKPYLIKKGYNCQEGLTGAREKETAIAMWDAKDIKVLGIL